MEAVTQMLTELDEDLIQDCITAYIKWCIKEADKNYAEWNVEEAKRVEELAAEFAFDKKDWTTPDSLVFLDVMCKTLLIDLGKTRRNAIEYQNFNKAQETELEMDMLIKLKSKVVRKLIEFEINEEVFGVPADYN